MHKATCAECNKECEVPFKPTEGKPVYCRDCFQKHRPQRF
ncbi:MAG: CxxC-x17-CxxC domain-containing protein [Candidatus Woesearchaeota archaeon]